MHCLSLILGNGFFSCFYLFVLFSTCKWDILGCLLPRFWSKEVETAGQGQGVCVPVTPVLLNNVPPHKHNAGDSGKPKRSRETPLSENVEIAELSGEDSPACETEEGAWNSCCCPLKRQTVWPHTGWLLYEHVTLHRTKPTSV